MEDIDYSTILMIENAQTNIDVLIDDLGKDYEISVAIDSETALKVLFF